MKSHYLARCRNRLILAGIVVVGFAVVTFRVPEPDQLGQWFAQQELNTKMAVVIEEKEFYEVNP